ncbi:MAG TPA: N-acetylmuramoyl-L-alanine amidase [Vicinamibacteria bacterium]|nr:N-acetylmuramoyl-L-alanine amidase [Vicinamibacteria bacterium]
MKGFDRRTSVLPRRLRPGFLALAGLLVPATLLPAASAPLTVLTATQRREVATVTRPEGEMVGLEDVLAGFGVTSTSDPKGGAVTLQRGGHELVLHHRKSLASVDGDLKLLSAPAALEAGRWLVPVESLPRLVSPFLGRPVEWRLAQRILVVGPISIPRLTVTTFVSADLARVVFEATEKVPFRVQQEPGRVTVTVPRDLLDVSLPPTRLAGGIVESVQFQGGPENLFAVQLGPRFQKLKATEQESPARLVLELAGQAPAPGERPPVAAPVARAPRPGDEPAVRTVVIDPGHGGGNAGAQGPGGTLEKDVALSIARKLRAELVNERGLQVFLTRDKDEEVELDSRTAIANNYKADLFVSIHANASRARGAKGSEVYFLSYQASDDESRWTAQAEGAAAPVGGAAPGSDLALILWDMAQAEHLEESSALASRIQEELAVVTGSEGRGVKQAPFRVLVGAAMPAVLVEVAFISNPEEEKLLASDAYQAKVAASLARGIERFRRERGGRVGGPTYSPGAP